ncbi:MAG TPA: cytochrome c maturation protein CcmE [Roseiflexaceae bacterium]|jgi:cytochrome c-type biogenesis protein CcmE|nr:cytochrome c maturation protein CcmE [Roseiflexaceae bacterium]
MMTTAPTPHIQRRALRLKPLHMIGIGIIVLAIVLGYFGLQSSFRPYTTSIKEATASGRGVQLAGFLGSTGQYDAAGNFTFALQDSTGAKVNVIYPKPKPANFEQAVSIVAIGHYDAQKNVFMADDMLVKCPSKYQEQMTQAKG